MIRAQDFAQNLALASAAAALAGDALELTGGHVYDITSEWRLGTGDGRILFVHGNGATVKALAPMRAVLAIDNNVAVIRGVNLRAERLADYGVYLHAGSASGFEYVDAYQPLADGFHSAGESDRCRFIACSARLAGRIWHTAGYLGPSPANIKTLVTGTASVPGTSGGPYGRVVDFTGLSVPLTSMGLRRGDWISIDPTAPGHTGAMFWAPILSVDSASQLTLDFHPFFSGYTPASQFSIHRGDGFHFGPGRADNNLHDLQSNLAENTACSGFYLGGLYGARTWNNQVNAAGAHPAVIGGAAQDRHVLGTLVHGFYTENGLNGASNHILCEGAIGVDISTCNAGGNVGVTNPSTNVGVSRNDQYLTDISRYEVPIGDARSSVGVSGSRAKSAVILAGESSVAVSVAGLTVEGSVTASARDVTPQPPTCALSSGVVTVSVGGRVYRDTVVDIFVSSL